MGSANDGVDVTTVVDAAPSDAESWPEPMSTGPRRVRPRRIGRYLVGEEIGAGGMGVVYRARDPDLGRDVALKVLRTDRHAPEERSRGLARLLREAQAMAQLAHPNVITAYDVGTFADADPAPGSARHDDVFVAMELVDGRTLARWMREGSPTWQARLAVCVQAGRGLAAAHRAGLLHRDFKPSNVLVADDGRVLVMDFGLAATQGSIGPTRSASGSSPDVEDRLTVTGSVVGTPAYMAPELLQGRPPDERSDQFSLCATIFEVLFGARAFPGSSLDELRAAITAGRVAPVPRGAVPSRIEAIVRRGLSSDPAARWPSVDALLDALQRGRSRRRGRLVWSCVSIAVVAAAAGSVAIADDPPTCDPPPDTWNAARRDALRASFGATGLPYAGEAAVNAVAALDDWHARWAARREEVCRDAAVLDATAWTRATTCLRRDGEELAQLAEALSRADAAIVERVGAAVDGLPDPTRCGTTRDDGPPAVDPEGEAIALELIRARTLERVGNYAQGRSIAEAALERARALNVALPLVDALSRVGTLRSLDGDDAGAEAAFTEAVWTATEARLDRAAARAATSLVLVVGLHLTRLADGHEWARHAEAAIARMGGDEALQADLLLNVGLLLEEELRLGQARRSYERAMAIYERLHGADALDVGRALNNLGTLEYSAGDFETSLRMSERALAIKQARLGPEHPDVAKTLNNLGIAAHRLGRPSDARAFHERALAIRERTLSPDHPLTAASLNNLGNALYDLGDLEAAAEHLQRALAIRERTLGAEHIKVAATATNLATIHERRGRLDEARSMLVRAAEVTERVYGAEHPETGEAQFNLAVLDHNAGAYADAEPTIRRALDIMRAGLGQQHYKVGRVTAVLAANLVAQARRREGIELYDGALAIYGATLPATHRDVIDARSSRAWALLDEGDAGAALAELELALSAVADADTDAIAATLAGSVRWGAAQAIVATHGDAKRALALAERAQLDYADHPDVVARIDAWRRSVVASRP